MMQKATEREVYDFIVSFREKYGWSPTVREIGKGVGISSSSTVHKRLARMKFLGMVTDGGPRAQRTLKPLPESDWRKDADS